MMADLRDDFQNVITDEDYLWNMGYSRDRSTEDKPCLYFTDGLLVKNTTNLLDLTPHISPSPNTPES